MPFKKHYQALDHVIVAMACLQDGKPVTSAKHLQKALECPDFSQTLAMLDNANDVLPSKTKAKTSLAHALTVIAAKAKKDKKKAKPKKKAKANVMTIAEVDLEDLDLTEEDLLDSGDDVSADMDTVSDDDADLDNDGDIDLDDLELDTGDDEVLTAQDEDSDDVLEEDDVLIDEDEENLDVTEAEAVGTDAPIVPGKDGTPNAQDLGEPSTEVKTDQLPTTAKAKKSRDVAAARRLLSNIQVLEAQAAKIKPKTKTK